MTLEFLYYSSLVLWLIGVYFLRDLKIRLIKQKRETDYIVNEILHTPLKHNHDGGSSFVSLDIILLKRFPNVIFKTLNYQYEIFWW